MNQVGDYTFATCLPPIFVLILRFATPLLPPLFLFLRSLQLCYPSLSIFLSLSFFFSLLNSKTSQKYFELPKKKKKNINFHILLKTLKKLLKKREKKKSSRAATRQWFSGRNGYWLCEFLKKLDLTFKEKIRGKNILLN